MGGRGSWAAPGAVPGAGDLVTHELCHWWPGDLAALADHAGPVFDLPVQAMDTEYPRLACFTFSLCQDLGNSLVPHCAVAIRQQ